MTEDPVFDPWSAGDEPLPASVEPRAMEAHAASEAPSGSGPLEVLRRVATARLATVAQQLTAARHEVSMQDLLDEAPRLLRFRLRPWAGPLAEASDSWAMLELGLGESGEQVTAWYWLQDALEAPDEARTVPRGRLTSSWIEQVILDFVGKALERR